jgi:spore germination protein KC
MRVKFFKVVYMLLAVILAGGCWDITEIEDKDIAMSVIVDFNEGEYAFYVEIAAIRAKIENMQSEQSTAQPPALIVSAQGKTFAQARENLDRELNKKIFVGAVQALMITQRFAENGIAEYVYRVRQTNEYRKTIDVLVIKDDPQIFLESTPENALSVGFATEFSLENLHSLGKTFHMSLADLLDKLASQNDCYLMSILTNKSGQIALSGYAVFDGPKMVGETCCEHGIVYIAAYNNEPDFVYVVPVGETHVTIEAKMKGRNIDAYYEGNKVRFKLDFSFEGTELYPETNAPVTEQMQQELKSNLENMIMQEISGSLLTSRDKFGCDYMSLSEAFRIKYPDVYKNMDWDAEFRNAGFDSSVSASLTPDKTFDYDPEKK